MAVSVEFRPEARADFDAAYNWYAERSVAAAVGFASEIDVAIDAIVAHRTASFAPMLAVDRVA